MLTVVSPEITLEQVLDMYNKHNIQPKSGLYCEDKQACALGVLLFDQEFDFDKIYCSENEYPEISKALGLPEAFVEGFIDGFDARESSPEKQDESYLSDYALGHSNGDSIRLNLIEKGYNLD